MFTSGVPEKIVAEFTGLTSLRQYERTTETQLQAAGQSIARLEEYTPRSAVTGSGTVKEADQEKQVAQQWKSSELYHHFQLLICLIDDFV